MPLPKLLSIPGVTFLCFQLPASAELVVSTLCLAVIPLSFPWNQPKHWIQPLITFHVHWLIEEFAEEDFLFCKTKGVQVPVT